MAKKKKIEKVTSITTADEYGNAKTIKLTGNTGGYNYNSKTGTSTPALAAVGKNDVRTVKTNQLNNQSVNKDIRTVKTVNNSNADGYTETNKKYGDYYNDDESKKDLKIYKKDNKFYYKGNDGNYNEIVHTTGQSLQAVPKQVNKTPKEENTIQKFDNKKEFNYETKKETPKKETKKEEEKISTLNQIKLDTADLTKEEKEKYKKTLLKQEKKAAKDSTYVRRGGAGLSGAIGELKNMGKSTNEKAIEPIARAPQSYDYGKLAQQQSLEYYKAMMGEKNNLDEINRKIANYNMFNEDIINSNNEIDTYFKNLPNQVSGIEAGVKNAGPLGAIGAGVGGIAGAILTRNPASTLAAAEQGAKLLGGAGYIKGQAENTFKLEAGATYQTLLDMGVPQDIAKEEALKVGTDNALIESGESLVDLLTLGKGSIAVNKLKKGLLKKYGAEFLENIGKSYGGNLITESGQESWQEQRSIAGEKRAAKKTGIERDNSQDARRIFEAGKGGFISAAISGAGTRVAGITGGTAIKSLTGQAKKALEGGANAGILNSNANTVSSANQVREMNEVEEQVNNREITPEEGQIRLQEIANGTYQQNKNIETIANNEYNKIEQAVQSGQMTPEQGMQEMELIQATTESMRKLVEEVQPKTVENKQSEQEVKEQPKTSAVDEAIEKHASNLNDNEKTQLKKIYEKQSKGEKLTTKEQQQMQYFGRKQKGLKNPELTKPEKYQDVNDDYGRYYKNADMNKFNSKIADKAANTIEGSRYGRTKEQWYDLAKNIGMQADKMDSESLKKYAFASYKYFEPNKNINRQGNKNNNAQIHEWVKAVYEGARVGEKVETKTETKPKVEKKLEKSVEKKTVEIIKKPTNTNNKIQNFRNSIENEKVNDVDGFYKSVEKIIKDKDYNVILDSSITNEKGQSVNALITNENGVTIKINPKSKRAGEILLMHEVTHGIETKEMRNLIMDYAKKNSEFNNALEDLKKTYGNEDVTPEVIADISGQLLGNQEFINSLSVENPSLFKKIYDAIVSLKNKLTGNSKYENFVKDLEVKWQKAYRESNQSTFKKSLKESAMYSQNAKITDDQGRELTKDQVEFYKNTKVVDDEGHLITVYHTTTDSLTQFNIFNPPNDAQYRYGDQVTIFTTDSKIMSGSYADWNYEMADTQRINSIDEFKKKIDKAIKNDDEYGMESVTYKITPQANGKLGLVASSDYVNESFIKTYTKEDFLRNAYFDLLNAFGSKGKIQYELYMNIENPYIIDCEGRAYGEAKYELYDDIKKVVDKLEDKKEKLHKLALESEQKHKEFLKRDNTKYNIADKVLRNVEDEALDEARNRGLFNQTFDYKELYNLAKKEGLNLPEPNTTMEDIVDYYAIEDLKEEWDEHYIDNYLNKTVEEFVKEYNELNKKYKEYGMEDYNWFANNYKEIIGDETLGFFRVGSWFNIAKDMFSITSLGRAGGAKAFNTNDIVHYILAQNKSNLENQQYDGVIFKNISDYTSWKKGSEPANVYVAFNSNQVKAVDNKTPTSDPDIRYSKNADKWQQFLDKYFKERGTTTNLSKKITTSNEVINSFNEAKKGNIDGKKLRSWVNTSNEATGNEDLIDKADIDKITYDVQTNEKTYKAAKKNLDGLSYEQRLFRTEDKLNSNKKVTAIDLAEAQIALLEAAQSGRVEDYLNLQQDVAIIGTELGQAVQAMSMIQKMSPDGQIAMLNKIVNRQQKMGNKNFEDVKLNPDLVQKVLDSYDDASHTTFDKEKMDQAVDELKQDIADQMKTSVGEKINAWRYLSMLGNPKTHVRNIVANIAMSIVKGTKDTLSAAGQDTAAKVGLIDKSSKTRTLKRTSKDVKALADVAYQEVFKNGANSGNKYNESTELENRKQIFNNEVLEKLRKANENALSKEDQMFKNFNFKLAFSNYLTAQGINTTEEINAHPEIVASAKAFALQEAKVSTFQQENNLAKWINKADNLGTVGKVIRGAIIPFTRTPLNIAKTGIEYAPGLGFATAISDMKKAPENMKGTILIDGISKQVTGSALALLGYALAKSGWVTGDDDDDKESKFKKDQGAKMGYSIKINGKSYDLSWLSPSSMPFFVGARMYEVLDKQEQIGPDVIIESIASTLDPLSEMSCISSFTKVLKSFNSGSMGMIKDMGETTLQNYISQFVPTVSGQFARLFDTKKRNSYADNNSNNKFIQETYRGLAYKIPGLRNMLPESTDYYGDAKKETENMLLRAIESFVSPANTRKDTMSKESKELVRLYKKTGNDDVLPSGLQTYINYNDEKYDMSQKEYNQYKKSFGKTFKSNVKELMNSDEYINASDEEKAQMISGIMKYSKDKAKDIYLTKKGEDYSSTSDKIDDFVGNKMSVSDYYGLKVSSTVKLGEGETSIVNGKNALKNIALVDAFNIDPVDYLTYSYEIGQIKADKRANGKSISGSAKRKKAEYIQSLPLSAVQKQMLYSLKVDQSSKKQTSQTVINTINNANLTADEKQELYNYIYNK